MTGVSYITDEKGKKNVVVLDLKKFSKVREDLHDIILSDE